jgi:hypothetical protein
MQQQRFVRAYERGNQVIYVDQTGRRWVREGGTRSWRNNNPGNLRSTRFTRRHGAIGSAGGFAVFPDYQTGRNALATLLRGATYRNLTIAQMVSRYTATDQEAYRQCLRRYSNLNLDRRIRDLTDAEFQRLLDAIQRCEGWREGREFPQRRVIRTRQDRYGRLIGFLVEGETDFIPLEIALQLAERGEIEAVIVHPRNRHPYIRAYPDAFTDNNFDAIAERMRR